MAGKQSPKRSIKSTKSAEGSPRYGRGVKLYGALILVGFLVAGGAIMLGRSDTGAIDVTAAINNSNREAAKNASANGQTHIPVANTRTTLPNGGLVARGKGNTNAPISKPTPPPQPVASSTATSTDSTASSTASATDANGTSTPSASADAATTDSGN